MTANNDVEALLDSMQDGGFFERYSQANVRAKKGRILENELAQNIPNQEAVSCLFIRLMVDFDMIEDSPYFIQLMHRHNLKTTVRSKKNGKDCLVDDLVQYLGRFMPTFYETYKNTEIKDIRPVKQTTFDESEGGTLFSLQIAFKDGNLRLNMIWPIEKLIVDRLHGAVFIEQPEAFDVKLKDPPRANLPPRIPKPSKKNHHRKQSSHVPPAAAAAAAAAGAGSIDMSYDSGVSPRRGWGDPTAALESAFRHASRADPTASIQSGVRNMSLGDTYQTPFVNPRQNLPPPESVTPCTDDTSACVVCMEFEKTILVVPCAHKCLCAKCAHQEILTECPICRGKIQKLSPVYD